MSDDTNKKSPRARIDWERIEPEWRAGVKSVLQIAADYEKATGNKISHTAINKHFKELNVPRDLEAKVQARAQAKVSAAAVSAKVSTETKPADAVIIEANADMVATVMLSQRNDIKRSRSLAMRLLDELEQVTDHGDKLEAIAEMLLDPADPDDKAAQARRQRMMDALNKATSLNGRVDNIKKLSDTLKTLIGLEREAFNIGADSKNSGYEDWLDDL